jgi:hypothetical protein
MSTALSIDQLKSALASGRDLSLSESSALLTMLEKLEGVLERKASAGLPTQNLEEVQQSIAEIDRIHQMIFVAHPDVNSGMKMCLQLQMNFIRAAADAV